MLTEASIPGSDDWYLMDLATEMGKNFPRLGLLRRYREGDAPVPEEATAAMREAYRKFVKSSRLNMCDLIVNAKTNRQKAVGFRTSVAGDELGDDAAWQTWRRSHMAVGSRQLFADAGHYGDGFLTVFGTETLGTAAALTQPLMVPSNGWTTWTRANVRFPWITEYSIEVGFDAIAGVDRIIMYGRGWLRIAEKPVKSTTIPSDGSEWRPGNDWTWVGEREALNWTANNPIVRYSTLTRAGIYENHTDTIDRINDGIKQRATIQAMQAFKQRAVKGDMPDVYPAGHELAGQKVNYDDLLKAGPAAIWLLPEGADIWESTVTDTQGLLNGNKDDKKDLCAVTATPLYTLIPDAASGSATGADVSRETLTFSVEELNDLASDALATAHGLAFEAARDTARADPSQIEVIWASIDRASVIERATASQAAKAGGMTQRMIDEKVFGLTPAEQRQAQQDREDEAFLAPVAA